MMQLNDNGNFFWQGDNGSECMLLVIVLNWLRLLQSASYGSPNWKKKEDYLYRSIVYSPGLRKLGCTFW